MVKVYFGNNMGRQNDIVDSTVTLKQFLDDHGVDYTRGTMTLDGAALGPGDINKTFAAMGYDGTEGHNKAFLLSIVKADNA